jgi:hypothetical protein
MTYPPLEATSGLSLVTSDPRPPSSRAREGMRGREDRGGARVADDTPDSLWCSDYDEIE